MVKSRALFLFRPQLPGQRAQAIQVVHAAHALARRGVKVTVLADRSNRSETVVDALTQLGLRPVDGLDLRLAPVMHKGAAGLWFRAQVLRWALGPPGVVWCRDLARLVELPWRWGRHQVVLEVHGLESGRSNASGTARRVERSALRLADRVVANCEGTAEAWRKAHGDALPGEIRVAHNGVSPHRRREAVASDGVIRVVGSLRPFKGWNTLLDAATIGFPAPVEIIGGEVGELGRPIPPGVTVRPAVPFVSVPDILAQSSALVLPLADNTFGRSLTSPLKLFDYLATAVPLVLPDLPSVRHAVAAASAPGEGLFWYRPGHAETLVMAAQQALRAESRTPTVRTWDARLDELLHSWDHVDDAV